MNRPVTHAYRDPLDVVWLLTSERIGLTVIRSREAFAATDGAGTLVLGTPETLDVDDCLAQMILHELCHSLVEGPDSFRRPDWGLQNQDSRDLEREHACVSVQAALLDGYGLRHVLAPTTEHRAYYDSLDDDPLSTEGAVGSLARLAFARSEQEPWAPHLHRALDATRTIVHAVASLGAHSAALEIDTIGVIDFLLYDKFRQGKA